MPDIVPGACTPGQEGRARGRREVSRQAVWAGGAAAAAGERSVGAAGPQAAASPTLHASPV